MGGAHCRGEEIMLGNTFANRILLLSYLGPVRCSSPPPLFLFFWPDLPSSRYHLDDKGSVLSTLFVRTFDSRTLQFLILGCLTSSFITGRFSRSRHRLGCRLLILRRGRICFLCSRRIS